MTTDPADALLSEPVPDSPYLCPGSTTAVSRAIHLARLHAGWPGCDRCDWRDDMEGLARSARQQLTRIRGRRTAGIRRTEFGVRGVWLNDLTRSRAGILMRIFCDALYRAAADRHQQSIRRVDRDNSAEPRPQVVTRQPLVAGFDGRPSALDLFAGMTSAIRESGFPVIDIGRCTAASLLEAIRSHRGVTAGVLATGSGCPSSFAGFDVFDGEGNPIPVRWNDYGIRLHAHREEATSTHAAAGSSNDSPLPDSTTDMLFLDLPDVPTASSRGARRSGTHRTIAFEDRYRETLLRWYPAQSAVPVVLHTHDSLIEDRVRWLMSRCDLNLRCRSSSTSPDNAAVDALQIVVADDDREFRMSDRRGQVVPPDDLAIRLNSAIRSQSSHVTAHADPASGRFWLTDTARTSAAVGTEHIADALVTLGLILRLITDGHLPASFAA